MKRHAMWLLLAAVGTAGGSSCGNRFPGPGVTAPELAGNWSLMNAATTANLGSLTVDAGGNLIQINGNPHLRTVLDTETVITDGQAVSLPGGRAYRAVSSLDLDGRAFFMWIRVTVFNASQEIGEARLELDGTQTTTSEDISGDYLFSSEGPGVPDISNTALCRMSRI